MTNERTISTLPTNESAPLCLAVDIQVVAVRVEAASAGVEVSQAALVNISAVGERVPGKTNLISQILKIFKILFRRFYINVKLCLL